MIVTPGGAVCLDTAGHRDGSVDNLAMPGIDKAGCAFIFDPIKLEPAAGVGAAEARYDFAFFKETDRLGVRVVIC